MTEVTAKSTSNQVPVLNGNDDWRVFKTVQHYYSE